MVFVGLFYPMDVGDRFGFPQQKPPVIEEVSGDRTVNESETSGIGKQLPPIVRRPPMTHQAERSYWNNGEAQGRQQGLRTIQPQGKLNFSANTDELQQAAADESGSRSDDANAKQSITLGYGGGGDDNKKPLRDVD